MSLFVEKIFAKVFLRKKSPKKKQAIASTSCSVESNSSCLETTPPTPSADCNSTSFIFDDLSNNNSQQSSEENSTSDAALLLEFERLIGPPKRVTADEYLKLQNYKFGSQNDAYATYSLDDLNEDLRFYSMFSVQGARSR